MRVESAINFNVSESFFFRCAIATVVTPKRTKKSKDKFFRKRLFFMKVVNIFQWCFPGCFVSGKYSVKMTNNY